MVVRLEFFVCIWVSQSPLVCSLGLSPISVGFWTSLSPNVALDGYQKKPRACYFVFSQSVVVCDDVYEFSLFFYRMQSYYRDGDAAPERTGAGETGMSPSQKPVRSRHATAS